MSSRPPDEEGRRADSAAAHRRDKDAEFDRRIDEMFDDMIRTFKIWLTLSQLVVIEVVVLLVLVARD